MKRHIFACLFLATLLVNVPTVRAECTTIKSIVAFKDMNGLRFFREAIHLDQFVPGVKDRAVEKLTKNGDMFDIEPGTLMKTLDFADRQQTAIWVKLPDGKKACILIDYIANEKLGLCKCSKN